MANLQRLSSPPYTPVTVHPLLVWCLHLLVLAPFSHADKASNISYGVPWGMCEAPIPKIVAESTGAVSDAVLSLCLRSNNPTTTFENAETFFIGNSSNPKVKGFGTLCARINKDRLPRSMYKVQAQSVPSQPYTFMPTNEFPLSLFDKQAWEISLWDVRRSDPETTVDLTISNFGETDLQITGIDFGAYGLDDSTYFPIGNVTTLSLNLQQVAKNITFEGLPILQNFLEIYNKDLPNNTATALVFVRVFDGPNDPLDDFAHVTYAIARDNKSPTYAGRFSFFLYETTLQFPVTGTGTQRRRLLVATAKNKAPPTACSKGCCKPASPVPKNCAKGSPTWPNCAKVCSCACK